MVIYLNVNLIEPRSNDAPAHANQYKDNQLVCMIRCSLKCSKLYTYTRYRRADLITRVYK